MFLNKKIPSFTLSEMMVVLVISAIVISLAITTLSLVQNHIRRISNNFEKNTEIRLLKRILTNDFNKYVLEYNYTEKQLLCTNPIDTISYVFSESYILRNKDTMQISITENTVYLDAQPIKEGVIDAFKLTLSKEYQNREIFVFKQKDATFYMNN